MSNEVNGNRGTKDAVYTMSTPVKGSTSSKIKTRQGAGEWQQANLPIYSLSCFQKCLRKYFAMYATCGVDQDQVGHAETGLSQTGTDYQNISEGENSQSRVRRETVSQPTGGTWVQGRSAMRVCLTTPAVTLWVGETAPTTMVC